VSTCPVTTWSLLTRRQYRRYQGLAVGAAGGYPWVLSDTVPSTKYWLVWWASIIEAVGVTFTNPSELYVIPNGATLPKKAPGVAPDDPFFLNYNGALAGTASGPGLYGLRVDRYNLGTTGAFNSPAHAGDEVQMLDKPMILGPGETLMGWCQQYTTAPAANAKLEMRLCVSIMDQAEELPLLFTN
jgi:hypothetical protein